jgi:Arc/MetJ family transcription regulator
VNEVLGDGPIGKTSSARYPGHVSKTSVEVDQDILRQAAAILGTRTLRETIDAALREVVHAKRRLELIALLGEEGRFDFDAADAAWGADG